MGAMEVDYGAKFYERNASVTNRSAAIVAPLLVEIAKPENVIDVGCSSGQWLNAMRAEGVETIRGVDGEWIDESQSELREGEFERRDLSKPFSVDRTFDLATTFEVAEHLPPESAAGYVASLVALAPIVAFSAAIPGQGGHHHLNEQWPGYWVDLFAAHDYVAFDPIRPKIWDNSEVVEYYRQNIGLFVDRSRVEDYDLPEPGFRSMAHPEIYAYATRWPTLRQLLRSKLR